jgi:Flp pilus assembly protein TadB
MKLKLNPIQNLWVYFGVQSLVLIFLLLLFAVFQPRFSQLVSKMKQQDARRPTIEQSLNTASPERLHKDAFILLDQNADDSSFIQMMLKSLMIMLGCICVVYSMSILWLGICLYKLHGSKRSTSPEPMDAGT